MQRICSECIWKEKFKLRDIKLIAIDGLDGTGKTTFAKFLSNDLQSYYYTNKKYDTRYQHFPVYELQSGKKIKDFLFHEPEPYKRENILKMIDLQETNRMEWTDRLIWDNVLVQDDRPLLMIADRYMRSNDIYNETRLPDWKERCINAGEREYGDHAIPRPDLQIFCYCNRNLQRKRLEARKNLDQYEALDHLDELNDRYITYLKWYMTIDRFQRNTVFIPMHLFDREFLKESLDHKKWNTYYKEILKDYLSIFRKYILSQETKEEFVEEINELHEEEFDAYLDS